MGQHELHFVVVSDSEHDFDLMQEDQLGDGMVVGWTAPLRPIPSHFR